MKRWRRLLTVLLAGIFAFSLVMVIRQQFCYQKIKDDGEEAKQLAGIEENTIPDVIQLTDSTEQKETAGASASSNPSKDEIEHLPGNLTNLATIDLQELRTYNADVIGWISIPGTKVSYPLMQGEDNLYYLSHNWKNKPTSGGSVFLESSNDNKLTDFHTIAYAHRMRSDSMFGSLRYYKDLDYWKEHPKVYVVLDDVIYCYDIFSAHEAGVESIVYWLDKKESKLEEEFLQYCMEESVISTGLSPKPDDCILTLSTCTGYGYSDRWVVHGVLAHKYTREQEQ